MEPKPSSPVMDVIAPVHQEPVAEAPPEDSKPAAKKSKPTASSPKSKPPKERSGVGMAITATVIIVLGLAAMATFAYLKQNHQL